MRRVVELPDRPGWRDYFQIVTTGCMIILGFYILWQTLFVRWTFPSLIFGGALLIFGLYRIKMIWSYFHPREKKDGT